MFKQAAVAVLVIALAGCAGLGGLGDLGGILGSTGADNSSDARGVVSRVDMNDRRIDLDVNYVNNLRQDSRGSSIYFDSNTVVEFNNKSYRPEDLERGDEISIQGANQNGRYVASRITVLRDVNSRR